mmetsp:Transcript_103037/g.162858  ORF Transcript_103037/g.162858 Transcript_103037/m.162858 type:complete len:145 (+) Transcript_103037:55-489(+)
MPYSSMKMLSSFAGLELRDYFSSACPHCQHLDPIWQEAAETYTGPIKFRKIECADENWEPVQANAELCKGIEGYPTIKLVNGDQEIAEYDGSRSVSALQSFARKHENLVEASMPIASVLLPQPFSSRYQTSKRESCQRLGAAFL